MNRRQLAREAVALMLAAAAILMLVALISHNPDDPTLFHAGVGESDQVSNLVGRLGAEISAILLFVLGLASPLLPACLLIAAYQVFRSKPLCPGKPKLFMASFTVTLVSFAAILQLILADLRWRSEVISAGGFLGRAACELLAGIAGPVGRTILLVVSLVVSLMILTNTPISHLASVLRSLKERLAARWEELQQRRAKKKILKRQAERSPLDSDEIPSSVTLKKVDTKSGFRIVKRPIRPENEEPVDEPDITPPFEEKLEFFEEDSGPSLPLLDYLEPAEPDTPEDMEEISKLAQLITDKCKEFRVAGKVVGIRSGPVITTFEFQLSPGVKISSIQNLAEDLALAMKTDSVRIERIPGRATVGIEVPNRKRRIIRLRELLETDEFQRSPSPLTVALGVDIHGQPVLDDLSRMPHLLIGGFTGSGKSVGINAMIMSILYKASPDQVKFIMVDPKVVELGVYDGIPHLLTPIISDPKQAASALGWAVAEMERRYRLLADTGVRNLAQFNRMVASGSGMPDSQEAAEKLPYVVIVIDELADLMLTSSKAVEEAITRLAQKARAVGIHLICATQRPSVDVLTGTIKANFPCRIAYKVRTRADSRTILDAMGAERLLGRGDMLYLAPGTALLRRLHGPLVTEVEIARVVRHVKAWGKPEYHEEVLTHKPLGKNKKGRSDDLDGIADDPMYEEAARLVVKTRKASASFIQRRLHLGYARAARLIDMMEREGIVGPLEGSKREVLVPPDYFEQVDATKGDDKADA